MQYAIFEAIKNHYEYQYKLLKDNPDYKIKPFIKTINTLALINKGTLTVNGSIKTTNLLVENGSTLKVTATNNDATNFFIIFSS